MAWRPHEQLIEGELSNRVRGVVSGHLVFSGMDRPVILVLQGDFHRDIRGASIRLSGQSEGLNKAQAREYMEGFGQFQTGQVGDITAGREPVDYVDYPYIEWYSAQNGRVVLELLPEQLTIVGKPLPAELEAPNDPAQSRERFMSFMAGLSASIVGEPN